MLGSLVEQSSEWYFDISKIILKLIISKSKFTFSTGTLSNCWDYDNFWTYTCVRYSLLLGTEEISIYRKWIHTAAEWHDSMRPCMSCQWAGQACETGGTSGIFGRSYLTTAPAALRIPRPLHSPSSLNQATKARSYEDTLVSVYKCSSHVQDPVENAATCWFWNRHTAPTNTGLTFHKSLLISREFPPSLLQHFISPKT